MREVYIATALQQIDALDSSALYRTARRLLDRVSASGELHLEHDAALAIVNTTAIGTLRAHLIALQSAGIIQYAINHQIHVGFLAWPMIAERANSRGNRANFTEIRSNSREFPTEPTPVGPEAEPARAEIGENRAEIGENRANFGENRAEIARNGGTIGGLVGWLDCSISSSDQESNQPTNLTPNLEGEPKPNDPVEHALSLALLTAAGVAPVQAKAIADAHPFGLVQRAVGFWWDNRETKFKSPGIIVYWFKNLGSAGIPGELSAQFRRSDLYRRHRTRSQIEADSGSVVVLRSESPPVHRGPVVATDDPLGAMWSDIVATRNPSQRLYLEGARLTVLADGHAQIVADARFVPWLNAQMSKAVERELAMRGHPASVIFVAEVAHA